ncbi:MAG: ATP-dependent Clp protease adaptor ClpS [Candidatus Kapabacteria bacterium]|jgi:ATP-dependent Clp protease adapter protein ClpS|nr:ATP-dependent Clp protease adaptor ClpS [Candidatus Kapabacteria bacterium]
MVPFSFPSPEGEFFADEDVLTVLTARVILYDDSWHTFDEVIDQLVLATGCSFGKAESITHEVHNNGKAVAYEGDMGECIRVSAVLEEIGLNTQIEM